MNADDCREGLTGERVHLVVEMWADLYQRTLVFACKGQREAYYQRRVRQETGLADAAWCEAKAAHNDKMSCQKEFHQLYCATATGQEPPEEVSGAKRAGSSGGPDGGRAFQGGCWREAIIERRGG